MVRGRFTGLKASIVNIGSNPIPSERPLILKHETLYSHIENADAIAEFLKESGLKSVVLVDEEIETPDIKMLEYMMLPDLPPYKHEPVRRKTNFTKPKKKRK